MNSRSVSVPGSDVRHWLELEAMRVEQQAMDYYQVDFVAGEPIEDLGENHLYASDEQNRLYAIHARDACGRTH